MSYSFQTLSDFLDSLESKYDVPGFDCLVVKDGKPVFRHTGGWADKENAVPMTTDRFFYLYSASKPITCAAALRAVEEGLILPERPVSEYLPEFGNLKYKHRYENGDVEIRPVTTTLTVLHLFTMCGGFTYDTSSPQIKSLREQNPDVPTLELAKALASTPLEFTPGHSYRYSLCHDILAAVVEKASGMRFGDYVKKAIFEPLGMEAYWHLTPELAPKMAKQYRHNDQTHKAELTHFENFSILGEGHDSGGAGIITSVDEYAKFAVAMANMGVGANGNRILSKKTVNLMRSNQLTGQQLIDFQRWQPGYGYGYGVRTKASGGINLCPSGEFGWDGAAGFMFCCQPEQNLAILYAQHMLNPKNHLIHPVIKNIVNSVLE